MIVSLTPELERRIAETIRSGLYASPDEVISEGLRLLFETEAPGMARREQLEADIRTGIEQLERGEEVSAGSALADVTALLDLRRQK